MSGDSSHYHRQCCTVLHYPFQYICMQSFHKITCSLVPSLFLPKLFLSFRKKKRFASLSLQTRPSSLRKFVWNVSTNVFSTALPYKITLPFAEEKGRADMQQKRWLAVVRLDMYCVVCLQCALWEMPKVHLFFPRLGPHIYILYTSFLILCSIISGSSSRTACLKQSLLFGKWRSLFEFANRKLLQTA